MNSFSAVMGGKNLDKKNWYRFFSPLPWHTKKKLTYLKRLQPYIAGAVVLACTGHQLQIFVSVQCNIKRCIQVRTLRITQSFYPAAEFVHLTCSILTSSILGEFLSLSMEDWLDMEVLLDSKPSSSSMPAQQIKIICTQCLLTSKSTLPGGKSADKKKKHSWLQFYLLFTILKRTANSLQKKSYNVEACYSYAHVIWKENNSPTKLAFILTWLTSPLPFLILMRRENWACSVNFDISRNT